MPIKFMFTLSQKLGQSFYQTSNMTIAAVTLKGSFGAGNDIILRIYELSDPKVVDLSNLIAEGSFPTSDIVKEESFKIALDESVELETGKTYFMSIEAEDDSTQAGVAFAEENIVDNGRMYVYTREIGGNGEIIDSKHSWHPNNNYDVIFTLQEAYLN